MRERKRERGRGEGARGIKSEREIGREGVMTRRTKMERDI